MTQIVSPDVAHDYLMAEYTVRETGFVYVYVSNNSPMNVYFDDVAITHTRTNVIRYNACPPNFSAGGNTTHSGCRRIIHGRGRTTATPSCTTEDRS